MPLKLNRTKAKIAIEKLLALYYDANIAVKASIWFTICSVVQKSISVLTMPIFTRLMSTEQFGQYNIYLTWYNILIVIVTLNVHSEIFNKGLIEHSDDKDGFTANQAGLLITLSLFWMLLYLPFRKYINQLLGLTTVLVLFIILEILGTAVIGLWSACKRFDYDYRKIVKLTLSMAVLNPLVGIIAVLVTVHKAEAKLIANTVIPVFFSIGILYLFTRKGRLFNHYAWWKASFIASVPLIPHYLSLVLLNQTDKLMINYFTGPQDAAIYSVAHTTGLLMTIVNNSINASFVPWAYDKLKNLDGDGIKSVSNSLLAVVVFVNVFMIWLAPEALKLFAAPQYSVAAWCLVPIAMSVFCYFAYTLFVDVEIYYGANHYITIASICATILNIALNYFFIPLYGYIAAGYTTLISYFATMVLHLVFLVYVVHRKGKRFNLFDLKALLLLSILLLLLSFSGMCLYDYAFIRLSIISLAILFVIWKRNQLLYLVRMMKVR